MDLILRSKRVCHGGDIQPADLLLCHDYIEAVQPWNSLRQEERHLVDVGSQLIVPGFVDLHSDAIEKEVEPRPGAVFPIDNALVELDKKLAMSGVTTMFHSISFNDEALVGQRGTAAAAALIRRIGEKNREILAVDNLVHARYEITSFFSQPVIKELIEERCVQLLSLMDHTPGQGQYRNLEKWKEGHLEAFEITEEQVEEIVASQQKKKPKSMDYLVDLSLFSRKFGLLIASHDDDTKDKIDLMRNLGVTIAEFPLSLETARYAQECGMSTGMGAPNVVRGRSQNGNISARSLLAEGCCDYLCSDYHPGSLLQAVYAVYREMGIELARAFSLITEVPAAVSGLSDRGKIEAGMLADLVMIDDRIVPGVVMTMKAGAPIYNGAGCFCM